MNSSIRFIAAVFIGVVVLSAITFILVHINEVAAAKYVPPSGSIVTRPYTGPIPTYMLFVIPALIGGFVSGALITARLAFKRYLSAAIGGCLVGFLGFLFFLLLEGPILEGNRTTAYWISSIFSLGAVAESLVFALLAILGAILGTAIFGMILGKRKQKT